MAERLKIDNFVPRGEHYHIATSHRIGETPPMRAHCHDFHEVFWVADGSGWHWVNNQKRPLARGNLVLIRAPDIHGFSVDPGGRITFVNVAFRVQTWQYLRRRYFSDRKDAFGPSPIEAREFQLSGEELEALLAEAREMKHPRHPRVLIERFLMNLMQSRAVSRPSGETDIVPDWLREACRLIAEPANFEHGTRMFAKLAHRSPEHVAREARRYLGKSPTDVVNEARMAYAATRLAGSSDKIMEISLQCGLENLSHFYKLFESRFGLSPRRYRLQQQRIVGSN
jgi:AraC family transcriptional regulator, dual regulator of chb operon